MTWLNVVSILVAGGIIGVLSVAYARLRARIRDANGLIGVRSAEMDAREAAPEKRRDAGKTVAELGERGA